MLWPVFLDTLLDALKLLPFLFLAYLLIEFIEHRASDKLVAVLSRFGQFSPVAGAAAGLVPQCGFSVAAAKLYAGRLISFGTLAAVFIATSDEAVPILIAHPESYPYLWKLLVLKFAVACVVGFIIDVVLKNDAGSETHTSAHDHLHEGCAHDECEHGILMPAIKHTAKSALFIFLVLITVNVAVEFVGEDTIASLFTKSLILQPLVASLVGLIPNCASSIILTELFLSGVISFGALVSGLIVNAGIAYIVLFRAKKSGLKRSFALTGIIIAVGLLTGYITQLF